MTTVVWPPSAAQRACQAFHTVLDISLKTGVGICSNAHHTSIYTWLCERIRGVIWAVNPSAEDVSDHQTTMIRGRCDGACSDVTMRDSECSCFVSRVITQLHELLRMWHTDLAHRLWMQHSVDRLMSAVAVPTLTKDIFVLTLLAAQQATDKQQHALLGAVAADAPPRVLTSILDDAAPETCVCTFVETDGPDKGVALVCGMRRERNGVIRPILCSTCRLLNPSEAL